MHYEPYGSFVTGRFVCDAVNRGADCGARRRIPFADVESQSLEMISDHLPTDLRKAVRALLTRVPCISLTPDDRELFARIRSLIRRITLDPNGLEGSWSLHIELFASGECAHAAGIEVLGGHARLTKSFPATERGFRKDPELVAHLQRMAEDGKLALSDDDWNAVAHLFVPVRSRMGGPRRIADALLFLATTWLPRALIPGCFGTPGALHATSLEVVRLGIWDAMVRILQRRSSPALVHLDAARFAKPRHSGRRVRSADPTPDRTPALRARRLFLD
ncbi:hypothetical protein AX289_32075 [Methylorubrum populi]|nr:hypothetical protein AX289_32075 [Methylorubrum populi]